MSKAQNLEIVIGDKNLSSWSMRPWLVLKKSKLVHKETQILLDRPETAKLIRQHSPSGKVPVLHHGKTTIWDSLAISEYLAELAPEQNLWPRDKATRATARSYAAEMHSGFTSLRSQLSMDIQLRTQIKHLTPGTVQDIERVLHMWKSALTDSKGDFLFGDFTIADAFFAPVVLRLKSYGVNITDKKVLKYMKSVETDSAVAEWIRAAMKERSYFIEFS